MMIDPFDRQVNYIRISVTDRCDFRCVYCMAENMTFLPKKDLLTLEELDRLSTAFIELGVKKIRLTGGEPLVRRDIMTLFRSLGRHLNGGGLEELTVTTMAASSSASPTNWWTPACAASMFPSTRLMLKNSRKITRWGRLEQVMKSLEAAAKKAGLAIKINAVALKDVNEHEIETMLKWAHGEGYDFTLIETMPLGEIEEDRTEQYLPLSQVKNRLEESYTLAADSLQAPGGPARYFKVDRNRRQAGFHNPDDP